MRTCLVVLVGLLLAACDVVTSPVIKGSGVKKSEVRTVDKFSAIELSGIGRLRVERTGTDSLTVTADDNLLPLFTSEVRNGTLYLSVAENKSVSGLVEYAVTVEDLHALSISGTGSAEAMGLVGDLWIVMSGVGSTRVAGRADMLTVALSGVGSLNAGDFVAKRAEVQVSGVGSATVAVTDELDATVSGVGSVLYIGSPKVTQHVSGVGSVKKR
jgi:hypothetical protein